MEFNLSAQEEGQLENAKRLLEKDRFDILTVKRLDTPPSATMIREEVLAEGLKLFNEERFWESHEVLEQIWQRSKGTERDALQGLILTAAAFVHYQKDEPSICISVLARAMGKLKQTVSLDSIDFESLRANVESILGSKQIHLFNLQTTHI